MRSNGIHQFNQIGLLSPMLNRTDSAEYPPAVAVADRIACADKPSKATTQPHNAARPSSKTASHRRLTPAQANEFLYRMSGQMKCPIAWRTHQGQRRQRCDHRTEKPTASTSAGTSHGRQILCSLSLCSLFRSHLAAPDAPEPLVRDAPAPCRSCAGRTQCVRHHSRRAQSLREVKTARTSLLPTLSLHTGTRLPASRKHVSLSIERKMISKITSF